MAEKQHDALANAFTLLRLGNIPKGGLLKPSTSLFHKVSFSLAVLIDPTWGGSPIERKLLQSNLNDNYRKKFCQLVDSLHKRFPHLIKPINKSWLVQAGGPRVVKCLFQLSTVALYLTLEKSSTHAQLVQVDPVEITVRTEAIVKESCIKISQVNSYMENAEEILNLYKKKSDLIQEELKTKRDILNTFVKKLSKSFPDRSSDIQELLNLYQEPKILKEWKCEINNRIDELEKKRLFLKEKNLKFSECMEKSKMVTRREKHPDEFTLEFNAEKDSIQFPSEFYENDLSTVQLLSLKNVQNEQTLNFPNLIKSFAILMSYVMQGHSPINNLKSAIELINDRLSYIQIVDDQSKNIHSQFYNFFQELKEEAKILNNSNIFNDSMDCQLNVPTKYQLNMNMDGNGNSKYWDRIKDNLILENLTFPIKEINGHKISVDVTKDLHEQMNNKVTIKISKPKSTTKDTFKKPSFIASLEETRNNMTMFMNKTLNRTTRLNTTRTTVFNSTSIQNQKITFSEHDHVVKLLTLEKKYPSDDSFNKARNKTKKWMSLFNEISVLEKTQSSPNLHEDSSSAAKSDIRISGIKTIDYSSFLSGMTSAPDSVQGSSKIEDNSDASKVYLNGSSVSKQSKEENTFKTPESVQPKSSRKSIDRLINTYRKFKETRLKDLDTTKVIEESMGTNAAE